MQPQQQQQPYTNGMGANSYANGSQFYNMGGYNYPGYGPQGGYYMQGGAAGYGNQGYGYQYGYVVFDYLKFSNNSNFLTVQTPKWSA